MLYTAGSTSMKQPGSRYILRARVIALPAAAALLLSCLPGEGLVHLTRAVERTDVEITAGGSTLIRSVYCDITIEPADSALWEKLGKAAAYRKKPLPGARRRVPPLAAFHVIIKSTIGAPLRLERSRIFSGDTTADCLKRDTIAARLRSPAYSYYDFASLLSYRRLTVERDSFRLIDYDRDTIASTFDFIPPGDTVVTMLFFERPPAGQERFRLTLEFSASGNRKTVSCDFTSRDYRASDREYNRIKKETRGIDDE
jgi:hypothetical protein